MRQVSVDSLKLGDILGKAIYSSSGRILLGKGVKLTSLFIAKLHDLGISVVYVEDERFKDIVIEDVVSEENRRNAMDVLEKSVDFIRMGKNIDGIDMQDVISNIVEEILFKKDILINMMDMRSKDNQMFAHSVNVCVLATVLGKAMNLDREKLETLATGALLHDIGKVHLDDKFFHLDHELTPEDREVLNTHPILGFEELKKRKDLNLVIAHIAFQHHEQVDGAGYPRKLKEGEIHPLAQMVGVADYYDLVTTDNSFEKRIKPHEACEVLMGLAGNTYPLEMVRLFLKNVAAYPTGVTVRLNTGEVGVVVDQNLSMPTRPIVRVFDDLESDKAAVKQYDLVEKRTIFIDEVLN